MHQQVQQQGISNSIRDWHFVLLIKIPSHVGKWIYNLKMLVPKARSLSLCLSIFSSPMTFPEQFLYPPSSSRGNNQLHTGNIMESKPLQLDGTSCSEGDKYPSVWSSPGGRTIVSGKQIFCNRSLNMRNIVAVGFDKYYTLAQYKSETFESFAYEGTVRKLVNDLGYPKELLDWLFDWTYMVRGLVLDKKRGNILKMDRHKYVKVAYHGFRELSKEDKVVAYGNTLIRDSFDEPVYALIDTLFSLAEAYLFAQLVDLKDNNMGKIPEEYGRMYKDVELQLICVIVTGY